MIIMLWKPNRTNPDHWYCGNGYYLPLTCTQQECIDHICDKLGVKLIRKRDIYTGCELSLRVGDR